MSSIIRQKSSVKNFSCLSSALILGALLECVTPNFVNI